MKQIRFLLILLFLNLSSTHLYSHPVEQVPNEKVSGLNDNIIESVDQQIDDIDFDSMFEIQEQPELIILAQEIVMPFVIAGINCFDRIKQCIKEWCLKLQTCKR